MITERQAQRMMAYLELARTSIDNAELSIVAAMSGERPGLALERATGQIVAGADSLKLCVEQIVGIANALMESQKDGASTVRPTAG